MKDTIRIVNEYFYDGELDLEVRTAALYTIYALYCHQMTRPRTKVSYPARLVRACSPSHCFFCTDSSQSRTVVNNER